jgi:hypothetical protein
MYGRSELALSVYQSFRKFPEGVFGATSTRLYVLHVSPTDE